MEKCHTEANSSGILYFLKQKYVAVIYFFKYLECILNSNTWIAIIKFWGHHASKFVITYSNGGHNGFNTLIPS